MADRSRLLTALTLALLAASPTAHAQDGDACERARGLFERGTDAVDEGRLAEGRDLLRRAADLCPIVQVWFNLGFALRRSGFTSEAVDVFEALLRGEYGALSPDQEATIREEAEGATRELATVRVTLTPPVAADLELDGALVGTATAGSPFLLRADAGSHILAARLGDATGQASIELTRGQSLEVPLELAEPEEDGVPTWLWVTGGVAIGIALVITIVVLALPSPLPQRGMVIET